MYWGYFAKKYKRFGESRIQFGVSETFWQNLIRFGKSDPTWKIAGEYESHGNVFEYSHKFTHWKNNTTVTPYSAEALSY